MEFIKNEYGDVDFRIITTITKVVYNQPVRDPDGVMRYDFDGHEETTVLDEVWNIPYLRILKRADGTVVVYHPICDMGFHIRTEDGGVTWINLQDYNQI